MSQPFRTPLGGRIQRDQPLAFRFNGKPYQGCTGDTLASALLANDVHLVGRSFKYHRPRGILSAGSEEPNALVTVDRGPGRVTPNQRATQIELYPGLTAHSQNHFPSLHFDLGAVAGVAAPLLSAGFYYKTFMGPPSWWHRLYEPAIRRAAGLGRAPTAPDPDRYLHQYAHCDVLVVGAGPAGLAAALAASASGRRVILCDEQAEPGGALLAEPRATIDGWAAPDWLAETLTLLGDRVTLLPRTTAFGCYPDNLIGLVERITDHLASPDPNRPRERLWQVRAQHVVLATGAIERPLVFPHNDRPGILLAGAARTYLHRYGVLAGSRVVIATCDDSAYATALDLHQAGVAIAAIVDQRADPAGEIVDRSVAAGIPLLRGTTVASTEGRSRVHTVRVSGGGDVIPCDTLLMAGGWTPAVHLFAQARGSLRFDPALGAFLPGEAVGMTAAGACAGTFGLAACLDDGWRAGGGGDRRFSVADAPDPGRWTPPHLPPIHPKAFVDFQNDVTTRDLRIATAEGFRSIEHVKRYTTAGMATDQGKTANLNTLATVAGLLGTDIPAVGLTTFRPPYTPVTFGALAGAARGPLFEPVRHTPIAAPGAVWEDVGTWKRARAFPRDGEALEAAVARECLAVRTAVGLFDASTLGKIEVVGPDAAEFLNRLYTIDVLSLAPGRCRYTLLLGEDGFVRDDGIIARLAADRFHVTSTTGGAASVLHQLEDYRQTEFPDLRVWLTSTTEQWAVIALQGPQAAATLGPLVPGGGLARMPHMTVRSAQVAGVPARLFRVSFTGEPGFEINVPAAQGQAVWDAVLAAGSRFGITRYGTDAMHVLRAEKGYIVGGQETDGTVTPQDLGLGWTIGKAKPDFVGKRSLARPDMLRPDRPQLVGLLTTIPSLVLEEGAQVVADPAGTGGALGHVTSSYHSAVQRRSIALALVKGGRTRIGSRLAVAMPNGPIEVSVVRPVFDDRRPDAAPPGRPPAGPASAAAPLPAALAAALPAALPAPAPETAPSLPVLAALSPDCAAMRVAQVPPALRLNIRAGMGAAASIGVALGVLLGTVPCRAMTSRDRAALWLGPDEWLVLAPPEDTDLAARLAALPNAAPSSIVDVSDRSLAFSVEGPRAAWCLNGFCALDLHPAAFPFGACTRTRLGAAEVLLWRTGDDSFHLEVARSLAPYVLGCLAEAQREFLATPAA
jgi:sarcosine oxidase subunit alpha